MKILTIKLQGVEHKLKYPIEFEENPTYARGKIFYILSNNEFRLHAMHSDVEMAERSLQESLNLIIDSYLFEPNYAVSESAIKLQNTIKRCVYG